MRRRTTLALCLTMSLVLLNPGAVLASDQCGGQQITPARLNQILTEGGSANILILDARSRENFLAGTIPGAISSQKLQDMINGAHQDSQDTTIVIVTRNGLPGGQLQKWMDRATLPKKRCNIDLAGWRKWLARTRPGAGKTSSTADCTGRGSVYHPARTLRNERPGAKI